MDISNDKSPIDMVLSSLKEAAAHGRSDAPRTKGHRLHEKGLLQNLLLQGSPRVQLVEHIAGRSDVWNRFNIIMIDGQLSEFAACIQCGHVLTFRARDGTSGLRKHVCALRNTYPASKIANVPDLSERMTMEGSHASGKLEGGSNYLTCSPILPGMPGMSDDMSEAGPSSGCQDQEGGPERPSGDYEHETVHVKTEPLFNVESEICEDENSQNNTQSSCDRRSSQASPTPGMTGPYLLKKETHCSTILDQLLRDDTFCDVTLTAEGQSIRAHKIVLCLASAYFRQVLSKDSTVQNVIVFRDIKFAELKNLINFIYTGEATVDAAELESFMKTAEMLEVTSLCDGQRSLPKNFLSKAKEAAETEKPKPSFGAKRSNTSSSSSCANSPPMKSRKIREVSPKSHKSLSYPSTSGGLAPAASAGHPNVPTPQIKSEPQSDDSVAEEGPYEPREMPAEFYDCAKSPTTRDQDHENDPYADSSDRAPDPMSLENPCPGRCPFCVSAHQQQLRHGLALTSHLATCHQDKIYFCCEICSRVFLRKSFFEGHKDDCNR